MREAGGVQRVDEVVGRRRRRSARMPSQPNGYSRSNTSMLARRDAAPADAVVAVGADDDVAVELVVDAVVAVGHRGLEPVEAARLHLARLEEERRSGRLVLLDQVVHELLLAVDRDRAADELAEVDVVPPALVLQVDAAVHEAALPQIGVEAELARGCRPSPARARRRGCDRARTRASAPRG